MYGCVCTDVYIHSMCMYVCTCMHACMHACMRICTYTSGSLGLRIRTYDKKSVLGQTGSVEPLSALPKAVDSDPKSHINRRVLAAMISGNVYAFSYLVHDLTV